MVTGIVPHVGGPIMPPGHPKTLIAGLPAARVSDKAICVGPPDIIVKGAPTTLIGGLPAARMGDQTAHGGIIVFGCPTAWIGDSGGGSGGTLQGMAMSAAKAAQKPFCKECAALAAERKNPGPSNVATPQGKAVSAAKQTKAAFCEECAKK
jgi:uncharacterized Zn-binding protein involved in type VI secretion